MTNTHGAMRARITRPGVQIGMLIAWGVLAGLAYPRANLWPLAHVALVPLTLVAVRGESLRRVVGLSYGMSLAWWCVMLAWLTQVTVVGQFFLCAYLAVYVPVYVVVVRAMARRLAVPLVVAAPLAWVACEFLRGWVMTGFPWFMLGHSQPTAMIQIADAVGAYGVSFVVAMTSGLICDLFMNPLMMPIAGRLRMGRVVLTSLVVWIMVMGGTLIYGAWRIAEAAVADDAPTVCDVMRVAVVQTDVAQDNKLSPTPEAQAAWMGEAVALTEQAAESPRRPHLIVWPETMVPRAINDDAVSIYDQLDYPEAGEYRRTLEQLAAAHATPLLVGSPTAMQWREHEEDGQFYYRPHARYNSAYLFDATGRLAARYDKMHRVVFGEYIPFADWPWVQGLLIYLTPYDYNYSLRAGARIVVFEVPVNDRAETSCPQETWRVAAPICFEDVVSYVCRQMVYGEDGGKRVDVLANLTNDGWYPGWAQGPQHEQIARFRCVENRVPMARAVNRGVSSFIDSGGRIVKRVEVDGRTQMVSGQAMASLRIDERTTLFGRLGDMFARVCTILTGLALGVAVIGLKRGKRDAT
jgi:apolipoprotein N-acyltransferase